MQQWIRRAAIALLALILLFTGDGCGQSEVNGIKAGKEFQIEETLVTLRKEIVAWQTSPKHTEDKLPDNLSDIDTIEREIATAKDNFWMGYYIKLYPKGDGAHYVLYAYPQKKGMSGDRSYYLDDSGSSKSHEYPDDFDQTAWDYDSLVKDFAQQR